MSMRSGKRNILIAGAIVILSGFAYLVYGGIGKNIVYFLTPGELSAKGTEAIDRPVRLGGQVVPGTVKWNAEALDLRFTLTDVKGGHTPVHSSKAPPQMFKEGQGVVVEGKLNKNGVFESNNLMVKHSNEYKAPADHAGKPQQLYKSLVKESSGM
jgi:cytochrome c-type biogenesis protein CcmE